MLDRIENISQRIDSHSKKANLSPELLQHIEIERQKVAKNIADARKILATMDNRVFAMVGSTDPIGEWRIIQGDYLKSEAYFSEAYNILGELTVTLIYPEKFTDPANSTNQIDTTASSSAATSSDETNI